jgi:hypothetical protein
MAHRLFSFRAFFASSCSFLHSNEPFITMTFFKEPIAGSLVFFLPCFIHSSTTIFIMRDEKLKLYSLLPFFSLIIREDMKFRQLYQFEQQVENEITALEDGPLVAAAALH